MPVTDQIVWFVIAPVATAALSLSLGWPIQDDPLFYLFDAWLIVAIGTWIARRRYTTPARVWRWAVVIVWVGTLGALANRAAQVGA